MTIVIFFQNMLAICTIALPLQPLTTIAPPPSPHMTHLTKICCPFQFDRRGYSLFTPTAQRLTVCTPCVCEQTIPRQLGWPELPPEPRPVYFGALLLRCYPHTHPYTHAHNNNILIYYMD